MQVRRFRGGWAARRVIAAIVLTFLCAPAAPCQTARGGAARAPRAAREASSWRLSPADDRLLEDACRRAFRYFWNESDPKTGLTLDRVREDGTPQAASHQGIASIAATGFGLTAIAIAAERGWVTPPEARERVRATLSFFAVRSPHEHGWFYHFVDWRTGERRWQSEVSSIDTALLLAGVLTVRQKFRDDPEIVRLATKIYDRVDFTWMLNEHPTLLSHGMRPESGWIAARWDHYCELPILYLLAIGSRTHPIQPCSWYAWSRPKISYAGYTYVAADGPLFVHQYSHAWVDFRGRRERWLPRLDYFENSVAATRAHRQFCLDLAGEFPGYSENVWGISASDSAKGYVAWGGPPRDPAIDGTVVPCAAGGSLMFAPDICVPALREMHDRFGDKIYGRYGFIDAFNPTTGWVNSDYIGIDVGITILSAENLRTGAVWRWFMRNPEIPRALRLVGLDAAPTRSRKAASVSLEVRRGQRLVLEASHLSTLNGDYDAGRVTVPAIEGATPGG